MSFVLDHLDLFMFPATAILLLRGYPVAFTLAGVGLAFALIGAWAGVGFFASGDLGFLRALFSRIFGLMDETNEVLVAVPIFILMGVLLERSGVAADLLETMARLFGGAPGGLGISVAFVGMLLAASTGIVGATVATMGLISLPAMLRARYDPQLAAGVVAASGTLGQIIPPSIVLVILADVLSNSFVEARRSVGDWAPEPLSVGDVFAGALAPGVMLVLLYIGYIAVRAAMSREVAPPLDAPRPTLGEVARVLAPPLALIGAVLGSILGGVVTATEAASIGALGALILAGDRGRRGGPSAALLAGGGVLLIAAALNIGDLRFGRDETSTFDRFGMVVASVGLAVTACAVGLGLIRAWRARDDAGRPALQSALEAALRVTAMVFAIYIGAQIFNLTFKGLGGDESIRALFDVIPGGPWVALAAVLGVMFLLGFFLDFLEIVFVVAPIMAPVLFAFSAADGSALFSPVWIAVLMGLVLQTSFLTPPFGFALFYLRGVAPDALRTADIYRGVVPFVLLQLTAVALVVAAPGLATWAPAILR